MAGSAAGRPRQKTMVDPGGRQIPVASKAGRQQAPPGRHPAAAVIPGRQNGRNGRQQAAGNLFRQAGRHPETIWQAGSSRC